MDESSEKGDAAGKTPPITHPPHHHPSNRCRARTMHAVFHWKHWEPALAFSQTIEGPASCSHGSDAAAAAVKSFSFFPISLALFFSPSLSLSLFFSLHPLVNKTSSTGWLAAFLNIAVAPMPRLMSRSRLEIALRHWWRFDGGLVQPQISEWVSSSTLSFLRVTCWICPSCHTPSLRTFVSFSSALPFLGGFLFCRHRHLWAAGSPVKMQEQIFVSVVRRREDGHKASSPDPPPFQWATLLDTFGIASFLQTFLPVLKQGFWTDTLLA